MTKYRKVIQGYEREGWRTVLVFRVTTQKFAYWIQKEDILHPVIPHLSFALGPAYRESAMGEKFWEDCVRWVSRNKRPGPYPMSKPRKR